MLDDPAVDPDAAEGWGQSSDSGRIALPPGFDYLWLIVQLPVQPVPADHVPLAAVLEANCPVKWAPLLVVPELKLAAPCESTVPETENVPDWLPTQVPEITPLVEMLRFEHVPLSVPLKLPVHVPANRDADKTLVVEACAI